MIEITSILYLKRLVRELNGQTDGFYAPVATFNCRCNRARLRAGVLECRSPFADPQWFVPVRNTFTDCYGREIVASRGAR